MVAHSGPERQAGRNVDVAVSAYLSGTHSGGDLGWAGIRGVVFRDRRRAYEYRAACLLEPGWLGVHVARYGAGRVEPQLAVGTHSDRRNRTDERGASRGGERNHPIVFTGPGLESRSVASAGWLHVVARRNVRRALNVL